MSDFLWPPWTICSPWNCLGQNTGVGCRSLLRGSSQPGIEPWFPALQEDSLPAEPPGKPKNAGVGNLSLLQRIFLTQESNRGLLHCKWFLYRLSYKRSPILYSRTLFIHPKWNSLHLPSAASHSIPLHLSLPPTPWPCTLATASLISLSVFCFVDRFICKAQMIFRAVKILSTTVM